MMRQNAILFIVGLILQSGLTTAVNGQEVVIRNLKKGSNIYHGSYKIGGKARENNVKGNNIDNKEQSQPSEMVLDSLARRSTRSSSNVFSYGKGGSRQPVEFCTVRGSTSTPTYEWCPDEIGSYFEDGVPYLCTVRGTTSTPSHPWCPEAVATVHNNMSDEPQLCTVRGSTDKPTYSWCPPGVGSNFVGLCGEIASGEGPKEGLEVEKFRIDLTLEIDGDLAQVLSCIEEYLQTHLAPKLSSCQEGEVGSSIENVIFSVLEDEKSDGCPYGEGCTNTDILADIYHTGDEDSDNLASQLHEEFIEACEDIQNIDGVVKVYDPCQNIVVYPISGSTTGGAVGGNSDGGDSVFGGGVTSENPDLEDSSDGSDSSVDEGEDGDRGSGIVAVVEDKSAAENDDGMAVAGIFGIVFAAAVLLALLALLLQRRHRTTDHMLKHRSFDDGGVDNTFIDVSPSLSLDDSRFSMYPEGKMEGMLLGERALNQDVHKCSSATCELCEQRRQAGVQFLPTKAKSSRTRQKMEPRAYSAEDTVTL